MKTSSLSASAASRRLLAALIALAPVASTVSAQVYLGSRNRIIAADSGLVLVNLSSASSENQFAAVWDSSLGGYTDGATYFQGYVALPLPETNPPFENSSTTSISRSGNLIGGSGWNGTETRALLWRNREVVDVTPTSEGLTQRFSYVNFVNQTGTIAIGEIQGRQPDTLRYTTQLFRWTSEGVALLPHLPTTDNSFLYDVTPDGTVIVGTASGPTGYSRAVYWDAEGDVSSLHPEGLDGASYAQYVSTDGRAIGINSDFFDFDLQRSVNTAYRWTSADGHQQLGDLAREESESTLLTGMSADGTVLVGQSYFSNDFSSARAVRWSTDGSVSKILPDSFTTGFSDARAVSRDGTVIVGTYANANDNQRVYRATSTNVIDIYATRSVASAASNVVVSERVGFGAMTPDGSVIVGGVTRGDFSTAMEGDSFGRPTTVGYYWSEETGFLTVSEWLTASGVEVPEELGELGSAYGISEDGTIIVGESSGKGEALYVAKAGAGAIDPVAATASVAGTARGIGGKRSSASLILNGAHGHPLQRRSETGRWITWGGGDLGKDNHGARDGDLSVLEAGVGYNFGPAQLNLALGRTDSKQAAEFNSLTSHVGRFAIADLIVPLADTGLFITTTGLWHQGDVDVRRGYLNVGTPTLSDGETDAQTYAAALRLDWDRALTVDRLAFTPFTKIVLSHGTVDAFTETSGPFPASYDEVTDTLTDAHLGVDLSFALTKAVRLVATIEGVHRFQEQASSAGFSIPGVITGASAPGEVYEQTWLSGGAGAEYDLGAGTFSLTLNASTEGPASSAWVASSYRYQF